MSRALVIGSCVRDIALGVSRIPQWGDQGVASVLGTYFGGKGANQALCTMRLGLATGLIARVGADSFGREFREYLGHYGIECLFRVDANAPTGMAVPLVRPDGERILLVAPGCAVALNAEDVRAYEGRFAEATIVVMQCEIDPTAFDAALECARDSRCPVVVNAAPWSGWIEPRLRNVAWLVLNRHEATCCFGRDPCEGTGVLREVERMRSERGIEGLVVTVGHKGAFVFSNELSGWLPPVRVKAIDSTGAGDAFCGGLAYGLEQGMQLQEVLLLAARCGAAACQKAGGCESMPGHVDVEALRSDQPRVRPFAEFPW